MALFRETMGPARQNAVFLARQRIVYDVQTLLNDVVATLGTHRKETVQSCR